MTSKAGKKSNSFIKKRRRKRFIRNSILLFILLFSVLIILCFKLPYFNIKTVSVENTKHIPKEEVLKLADIKIGGNIFYLNTGKVNERLRVNTYISNVTISRKLPDTIIIKVEERKAEFYAELNGEYYVIDNNGVVVETTKDINGKNLVLLVASNMENVQIGKVIPGIDSRKLQAIKDIAALIDGNKSGIPLTKVDISDILNINIYSNDMAIMIGTYDNISTKLNKGINILSQDGNKNVKGHIDVRFNGVPSIYIEK
jgi:cell division protein FtsQ